MRLLTLGVPTMTVLKVLRWLRCLRWLCA